MRVPDYISPIIGWRVWQWEGAGLRSLNGEPWQTSEPLRAGCRVSHIGIRGVRARAAATPHDAPEFKCTCGIYASKSLPHLRNLLPEEYGGIYGKVSLWGSVVEHEDGFRAEFAYPKVLYLPSRILPITLREIQIRIQILIAYGCDIFIAIPDSNIPIWRNRSGLDATGLDFLIRRGQEWHARRNHDRTLKVGDRIAVLGDGIAVVEQVTDEDVHARLWNREVLRIERTEISWEHQNMRWEVTARTGIR